MASEQNVAHAEKLIWRRLEAEGIKPEQVRRICSELQPCDLRGAYCSRFIQKTFPQALVTWSFEYGGTPRSRRAGLRALQSAVKALKPQAEESLKTTLSLQGKASMSPEEIIAFWGPDRIRSYASAAVHQAVIPQSSKDFLLSVGFPTGDLGWTMEFDDEAFGLLGAGIVVSGETTKSRSASMSIAVAA